MQNALHEVGSLPLDKTTMTRGALELAPGIYRINRPLKMKKNGVVLRGGRDGKAVLLATRPGIRNYQRINIML